MRITVVWQDRRGKWHIGTVVYGPQLEIVTKWRYTVVFEETGRWMGRPDGHNWFLKPTEDHYQELEAAL